MSDETAATSPAGATRRHLIQVARGATVNVIGAVVSAVAGLGLVVIVTNLFDREVAGTYFTTTSVVLLLVAVASLGTETGLARFMLRFEAMGRHRDIPELIRLALRPPLVLSALLGGVLVVAAGPVADLIGVSGAGARTSLQILGLTLPFIMVNGLALAGTRAFGRMKATAQVDSIGRSTLQPALAVVAAALGGGLTLLVASWAVPYVLAAAASSWIFVRFVRARNYGDRPGGRTPRRELRREFWSFTWPRAVTRVTQMALQRLDIVLVAALRSPVEAAIYTAATRFVPLGQVATQAIQQVLQPKFTQLLAGDDRHVLQEVYRTAAAWSMALAWPLYVTVAGAPIVYLSVFGEGYARDGLLVVLIMAAGMMYAVAAGAADTLLLMSGRSMLSLTNSVIALAINIALCFLLIPPHGVAGAAIAWAAAVVVRSTLALVQARVYLKVLSYSAAAGYVALASVLSFGLPLAAASMLTDGDPVAVLVALAVALVAYAGFLWAGRRVLKLGVLRDVLSRRR